MELTVEVTAEDIAAGVADDCGRCPVALAFARAIGSPSVYADGVYLIDHQTAKNVLTPEGVIDFMERFDNARYRSEVKPFSFEIDWPSPPSPERET